MSANKYFRFHMICISYCIYSSMSIFWCYHSYVWNIQLQLNDKYMTVFQCCQNSKSPLNYPASFWPQIPVYQAQLRRRKFNASLYSKAFPICIATYQWRTSHSTLLHDVLHRDVCHYHHWHRQYQILWLRLHELSL